MLQLSFAPGNRFVLVTGAGSGRYGLNAFDAALLAAGVGNYNLIKVSSILPPHAVRGNEIPLPAGSLLPIAYGCEVVEEPGHRIAASVGIGVPEDPAVNGVIMEFHAHGTAADAERIVRDMTADAMAMRKIAVKEILSCAVEALSEDGATAVFAACALIPAGAL